MANRATSRHRQYREYYAEQLALFPSPDQPDQQDDQAQYIDRLAAANLALQQKIRCLERRIAELEANSTPTSATTQPDF